jgi:hypothetical protein
MDDKTTPEPSQGPPAGLPGSQAPGSQQLQDLASLVADPTNRREHNERNVTMVADALRDVGAGRSIVIDEDDVILAGNGVQAAALQAGLTTVRVIEADGQEIIAVRRRGLTAAQKRALAIYDNRTAELATWNFEQLASSGCRPRHRVVLDADEEVNPAGRLPSGPSRR